MRRSLPLIINVALARRDRAKRLRRADDRRAASASSRPASLAADTLGTGVAGSPARDGRALVTVRIPGGAARLRQAGFDARALAGDVADLRATPAESAPPAGTAWRHHGRRAPHPASAARRLRPRHQRARRARRHRPRRQRRARRHHRHRRRLPPRRPPPRRRHDPHRLDPRLHARAAAPCTPSSPTTTAAPSGSSPTSTPPSPPTPAARHRDTPVTEIDFNGHGTHVAGIAASNGLATGNGLPAGRYVGVAPGAGLVVVQGTHGDASFTDSDVIAGCRFAVDEGARLGLPVVANLSLGSNSGPHDGSSDLEVALDALFPADQPGRALVIAAGNEGGRDQHAGAWALDGSVTLDVETASSSVPDAQLAFEMWHTGSFSISVISPAGHRYGPVKPGAAFNGPSSRRRPGARRQRRHERAARRRPPARQRHHRRPGRRRSRRRSLAARLRWPRPALGRLDQRRSGAATPAHFVDRVAEDDRLDMPATAHNAITVGSFITRNSWTTRRRRCQSRAPASSARRRASRSIGPDRRQPLRARRARARRIHRLGAVDATPAPTIPAPPSSSRPATTSPGATTACTRSCAAPRRRHRTSPAPSRSLFQADPTLTPTAVREILRVTAHDGGAGYTPKLGFGKLDVLAAAQLRARRPRRHGQRHRLVGRRQPRRRPARRRDQRGHRHAARRRRHRPRPRPRRRHHRERRRPDRRRRRPRQRPLRAHLRRPRSARHRSPWSASRSTASRSPPTHRSTSSTPAPRSAPRSPPAAAAPRPATLATRRLPSPSCSSSRPTIAVARRKSRRRASRTYARRVTQATPQPRRAPNRGSRLAPPRPTTIVRPLMWRFPLVALLLVAGCGAKIGDSCRTNIDCSPLGDRFCDLASPERLLLAGRLHVDQLPERSHLHPLLHARSTTRSATPTR